MNAENKPRGERVSLRDALARADYELLEDEDWSNATHDERSSYLKSADAQIAALRTELAAHPESIVELGFVATVTAFDGSFDCPRTDTHVFAPDQENQ